MRTERNDPETNEKIVLARFLRGPSFFGNFKIVMKRSSTLGKAIASVAVLVMFGGAELATATTIQVNLGYQGIASYSENGYTLTANPGSRLAQAASTNCSPSCADNGTTYLGAWYFNPGFVMTADNGSLFSLQSFDAAEFPYSGRDASFYWAAGIAVTGVRADGTTVAFNYTLDQINDGAGGVADFQTFDGFAGAFKEVRFNGIARFGAEFAIDNIVVSSVPEPSALLLVASALLGAGAFARRRQQ